MFSRATFKYIFFFIFIFLDHNDRERDQIDFAFSQPELNKGDEQDCLVNNYEEHPVSFSQPTDVQDLLLSSQLQGLQQTQLTQSSQVQVKHFMNFFALSDHIIVRLPILSNI